MKSLTTTRAEAVDLVATTFIPRSSLLMRLLASFGARELTRTEAGLLVTLLDGPHRITELAESEALAQPTVTKLVDKLQQRGLVTRERLAGDGRVVMVALSPEGRRTVEAFRSQVRELMRQTVEEISDEELAALVAAGETLGRLIDSLQQRKVGT
jgi:DNA-binding MarR family transcriptional regulator